MNSLYQVAGISKQAVHQQAIRDTLFHQQVDQLILEADELRAEHPGCGVEKMYYTLNPGFIGRDRFIELFMELGYRVRRYKNYCRTTLPAATCYVNLIKGMQVNAPSLIWQSDITYIRVGQTFFYAVFLIDVYTKIIVGYDVSNNLRAQSNLRALKMALNRFDPPMIHHSDRGSQFTYKQYIHLLETHHCAISMGKSAQDNAYAERINLTIKDEYLRYWNINSFEQLRSSVRKAVHHYNNKRQHFSLDRNTPREFFRQWQCIAPENRKVMTIFDNSN